MKYISLIAFVFLFYSCNKDKIASRTQILTQKNNVTFKNKANTYEVSLTDIDDQRCILGGNFTIPENNVREAKVFLKVKKIGCIGSDCEKEIVVYNRTCGNYNLVTPNNVFDKYKGGLNIFAEFQNLKIGLLSIDPAPVRDSSDLTTVKFKKINLADYSLNLICE